MAVKILEVCRVAPPVDVLESVSTKLLPLTFFDILWLRFSPVERLFFYQISSPNTQILFYSIIPKLKHSLSLTLRHFLPLTGSLIWPEDSHKPLIKCVVGDGVSLTIAESNMDFYHLSSNDFQEATKFHPLIPHLAASDKSASVMALQITVFPNCGFCIAITSHHAVLDGKSSTSFMKSWAQICKAQADSLSLVADLTPFYDRTVIKDPTGLEAVYANEWLNLGGPNNRSLMVWDLQVPPSLVRGTFELTREDIEKLRKSVTSTENPKRPSTFSLICGYTWVCLEKTMKTTTRTENNKAYLGFTVDCRTRLKPNIHPNYFGNCIAGRTVAAEREELVGENGVMLAVEAISENIRGVEDGVLNGAETWASLYLSSENIVRMTTIAGSPRFEVYSTDFGWGRPRKVEVSSIDRTGAISVSDSQNGNGGVELGLVLKTQEMEVFAYLFAKGLQAL